MPSVAERILAKTPLPTHLDSATIRARVAAEIRQRAFFSARMTSMTYLKQLQTIVAAYAHGEVNAADARWRCQQVLGDLGLDSGGHSLEDHGSARRLNLILETQRKMATNVARLDALDTDELEDWPAWRLERYGSRAVPREDWHARWKRAGDACGWVGAVKGDFVALKTSPIWAALGEGVGGFKDALGNPYPPFAYGSGLDWTDVSAEEATRLGLTLTHQKPKRASLAPDEREILEAMGKTGLRPEDLRALNKRDTHGHFATTEGEPCTHGAGKAEKEKDEEERKHQKVLSDILRGFRATCRLDHAIELLTNGINMNDGGGRPIKFVRYTRDHYTTGERRKGKKPKPKNLTYLPLVIHTLKNTTPIVRRPDGSESTDLNAVHPRGSQRVYSTYYAKRRFFVYVYHDSGVVSGWHLKD